MDKKFQEDLDLPFWDPDPRRVLTRLQKEVRKEAIPPPLKEGEIKATPKLLALSAIIAANGELSDILAIASKLELSIEKKQKEKLYLELLTFFYFLIGLRISQYLKDDQFTLFVLTTHVSILDNLPVRSQTILHKSV